MRLSQFTNEIYRRSYRASQFLRQHRAIIIFGAFVFWTAVLAASGYYQEISQTNTGFLIFGFLCMTVPMSFATYFIPRLVLRLVPVMNGYNTDDNP